jgi:transposase
VTIEPLPDEITVAHAVISKQQHRIVSLEHEVTYHKEKFNLLQRQIFGRSSERRTNSEPQPDQLTLEIVSQNTPAQDKALAAQAGAVQKIIYERKKAVATRIPTGERFPAELPRVDKVIPPETKPGVEYEFVRNDITERLGGNEIEFHVVRTIRPILKEREGGKLIQAPSDALFDRCAVEPSFIAKMLESKFCFFIPLYRQELMLKGSGIVMSRDSLIDYTIRSGALLTPIATVIHQEILNGGNLHIDETPVLVGKASGHGKHYKQSYLWPISSGEEVSFTYAAGRGKVELKKILPGFQGTLHSDGYAAYKSFCSTQGITQVCCMGHARREFVKAEASDPDRVSAILATIKLLYEIEDQIKKDPPLERLKRRQIDSLPLLKKLKAQVHEIETDPRVLLFCL